MNLRRACEHRRWEAHELPSAADLAHLIVNWFPCPGGTVTDTEALRRAIERHGAAEGDMWHPCAVVQDAARRWLALAEGDEAIMERIRERTGIREGAIRAVLAAITEEGE